MTDTTYWHNGKPPTAPKVAGQSPERAAQEQRRARQYFAHLESEALK